MFAPFEALLTSLGTTKPIYSWSRREGTTPSVQTSSFPQPGKHMFLTLRFVALRCPSVAWCLEVGVRNGWLLVHDGRWHGNMEYLYGASVIPFLGCRSSCTSYNREGIQKRPTICDSKVLRLWGLHLGPLLCRLWLGVLFNELPFSEGWGRMVDINLFLALAILPERRMLSCSPDQVVSLCDYCIVVIECTLTPDSERGY